MLTRKRLLKLFALLMVVSLVISACDRPLPSNDNEDPTPTAEGYPATSQENTATEQEPAGQPEPTQEVMVEGETGGEETGETPAEGVEETAEGGEEVAEEGEEAPAGEETAEGGEVVAEEGEEAPAGEETAEGGEEATAGEETAEGQETAEGEAETPAEETSGEGEEAAEGAEEAAEEVAEEVTEEAETVEEAAPETTEGEQEAAPEAGQPLPATHTVAAGENLYRIGLQYNISWVSIARLNGITNPDRIYVGQVLQIQGGDSGSGGQPEPVPTPMGINYVVKPGDTLSMIAQRFGVSVMEIAEANGLVNPDQIYAGQMLKIPVDAPTPPPVVYHDVKPGETLFRISLQYGVSWLAIARANNISAPYVIFAGQTLKIPGGQ